MTARALFGGSGAMRALRPGRVGSVELVLSRGVYVRAGDDWLLLSGRDAPFGPLSVVVEGLWQLSLRPGQPVVLERRRLLLGGYAVSLEHVRERRPVRGSVPGEPGGGARPHAVGEAAAAALAAAGAAPEALVPGLRALRRGWLREGVRQLAGRGEGLTPAGDDALAGYAAWRHASGATAPVSSLAAGRTSPLGHAYLRCAERGELPDAGAALVAAVWAGDGPAAAAAAVGLGAWGASSGAALLWGITAGAAGMDCVREAPL